VNPLPISSSNKCKNNKITKQDKRMLTLSWDRIVGNSFAGVECDRFSSLCLNLDSFSDSFVGDLTPPDPLSPGESSLVGVSSCTVRCTEYTKGVFGGGKFGKGLAIGGSGSSKSRGLRVGR